MSLIVAGQIAGIAFACGLNLYLTVAALGLLTRFGALQLPAGLLGLGGAIVIGSALALFVVEAVVDRIDHADSVWDALHTFIRPPAAALLAIGALWGFPTPIVAAGVVGALFLALTAHVLKAGLRTTLNATLRTRAKPWISLGEDALALGLASTALLLPRVALGAVGAALVLAAFFGPRLWRAFRFGTRCIAAWLRSIFVPARWKDAHELPTVVRRLLGETPLGAAPPRGARAAIDGLPDAGRFRNGWLVLTHRGPEFVFRTPFGTRRTLLPEPGQVRIDDGVWAHILRVETLAGDPFTLFMLKDGPPVELAFQTLSPAAA